MADDPKLLRGLEEREVTGRVLRPGIGDLMRDGQGTTLAVLGAGPGTRYRLFDREWEPLTPLLEVEARFVARRGLADGFLVEVVGRRSGSSPTAAMLSSTDGSLKLLRLGPPGDPLTAGSLTFRSESSRVWAFQPEDGVVWKPTFPATPRPGADWPGDPDGLACQGPYHLTTPSPTMWTSDGGATWRETRLDDLLPPGTPTEMIHCEPRGERIVLSLAKNELLKQVCVVSSSPDPPGARLLGCHPVPAGAEGVTSSVLADGRVVFPARKPGRVFVAADATNSVFLRRPTPTTKGSWVRAVGDDLVASNGFAYRGPDWVSQDAGRTWTRPDLDAD
jgi:hypothetical protein